MADIVRYARQGFIDRSRRWINGQHEKVLLAITRSRTDALGGHRDQCSSCGHSAVSYNSCRNRHCPRCQGNARIPPTRYVHAVFTLPHELAPLVLQNKRLIYGLLFRASAAMLLEVARDPQLLGAEIGFFSVLHTWDQRLQHHPHVHCVIAAGGLAPDHSGWIRSRRSFFLPVKVLGRVFCGKFVAALKTAFREGKLEFHGHLARLAEPRSFTAWLRLLFRYDWVVYSKRPFAGPEHALRYLGAYTHRVGISNGRLVALSEGQVSFRWRDSAHGNKKRVMSLPVDEFLHRFLLHLLPRGFVRIRNFGFLANRQRARLLPLSASVCLTVHPIYQRRLLKLLHPDASEMPTLRWNDATHRTDHTGPTASSLSTVRTRACRMNLQPQPRNDTVLLHAHQVCVLSTLYCPPLLCLHPQTTCRGSSNGDEHLPWEISAHSNFRPTVHHNQPKPYSTPIVDGPGQSGFIQAAVSEPPLMRSITVRARKWALKIQH